jgi:hypothetical protein
MSTEVSSPAATTFNLEASILAFTKVFSHCLL